MKKVIGFIKQFHLIILIAVTIILFTGFSIFAYYKTTTSILPVQSTTQPQVEQQENKTSDVSNRTDFSAKRSKREKDYYNNAVTRRPIIVQDAIQVEEQPVVPSEVEREKPVIEIPEKPQTTTQSSDTTQTQPTQPTNNQGGASTQPTQPEQPTQPTQPEQPAQPTQPTPPQNNDTKPETPTTQPAPTQPQNP